VPPDQVVKLPKADAKPEDLRAFYERLGAPKEAKDYDLSPVKDQAIADALRAAAHDAGVPRTPPAAVAKAVAKALESKATTQQTTLDAAKLAEQKERSRRTGATSSPTTTCRRSRARAGSASRRKASRRWKARSATTA
jgi:hypothetical protein